MVINGTCTGCHGVTHAPTGLAMATKATAYSNLVGKAAGGAACSSNNRKRVVASNANTSLLWTKINHSSDCGGFMPLNGTKLSDDKIKLVADWINAGAQDN
jgi:hypothetical protein